jgi:hypothetical protein
MKDVPDHAVPPGLADLPLAERQRLDVEWQRQLDEGLTRRHLAEAEYERCYAEVQFARALREGPALAAKLRGG